MTNLFQPRLLHGVFGDPGLYVRLRWERRALLLDLGDLTAQPPGELLRVTDIFVSHTHIDHFIGFDHLLRIVLGRDVTIRLFGPPGIIANVEGRLAGYTWNLVEGYTLVFDVYEVGREKITVARFPCGNRFERVDVAPSSPCTGVLIDDPLFRVEAVHLDHKIPCLAFRLVEAERINIDPERLRQLGLDIGPWLTEFKRLLRAGVPDDAVVRAPCRSEVGQGFQEWRLGDLQDQIVTITKGQRLVYVTDTLYSDENRQKILALAQDADLLFCEAMYLEQDREYAVQRHHLTARQAGLLAREANVKELAIFHFSPRYQECPDALYCEAAEAFGGPVRPN
ncbi:MAG: ribonuclease Z [Candidatus Methylomirabilota bacterium]|nr:MBL fold metallo-hydrolase [Candidatus Methylomirabilis sp.]NJD67069.1 ribonuclease Z [candidate division NC10 bacterium]PWB42397.1 MAG: ribonuclease Z [candidate division NC10 bacterium]